MTAGGQWPIRVVLLVGVAGACGDRTDEPSASLDFPAPPPTATASVSRVDFVGSAACASCHTTQHDAWSASTHGRAGNRPGRDQIIAPFDGRAIPFADGTVTPRIRSGSYEFVVRQTGFRDTTFVVSGVIGRGHMLGGGTQGFLTSMLDGTERFLPWDWSDAESTWFCNTGSRLDQGWIPIGRSLRMADCGDWPPVRPIGTVDRFANCQDCHGSQITASFDADAHRFDTEYTTLQVNCESCHGPAREHVERAEAGTLADGVALTSLAYLEKDESLGVCLQCHALKDVIKPGYLPGEPFEEYYALKFAVLGDQPYFADGRVRSFAYQANHLASACYLQGPMDCVSCHEPHSQGYWDTNKRPLASPLDDGQCTSCHASKAENPEAHTFHPPASAGARCVSCHMPYLQHPEVGPEIAFARSDHTIAVPRPVFDGDLGIVGACAGCHEDQTPLQLQGQTRRWWGELKPHRPLIQGQVDELRARNVTEAADLLLIPDEVDPLIQFQALARLVTGYLQADSELPTTVVDRLTGLTASPDLDVRSLALAALHWSRGQDPATRRTLVAALGSAPNDAALRGRWVLALGFLGDRHRERGESRASERAYRKALELVPGNPRVTANLGLLYNQDGRSAGAVALFRESLAADPVQPLNWVNLGIALAAEGDVAGARQAYEEAIRLNPFEAVAHFNLGNLHQRAQRLDAAVASYQRAVAADPGLGRAHFEAGRTLIRLERYTEALPHARRAVEFMPDHASSRQMLSDLLQVVGP